MNGPRAFRPGKPSGPKSSRPVCTAAKSRIRQEINHFADVADTLAELPSPEQVLALHPSPALAERIQFLLAKKNDAA